MSKRIRIFAREPGDSQVSGHCGEEKHWGFAVLSWLVSLLSLVPERTRHGLGRGPYVNPWGGGGGAAKAWYSPLV